MAQASIPVDLFNPGQVFACIGFLEAANTLLGEARGGFDWRDELDVRFHVNVCSDQNPFQKVMEFIANADVFAVVPHNSGLNTKDDWNIETVSVNDSDVFPFPVPTEVASLPAAFVSNCGHQLLIEYWGDEFRKTRRNNVKFWGGSKGKPGAKLAVEATALVFENWMDAVDDPFSFSAPQSSSFRFDWRRDYIPIEIGFSINNHKNKGGNLTTVGYPWVELLAAIGLTNARPEPFPQCKLRYRYGVIGLRNESELFDPCFLRAGLGCSRMPFPQRTFLMHLGWPGKENQSRCITNVTEESKS